MGGGLCLGGILGCLPLNLMVVVFKLMLEVVPGPFFCFFLGFDRTLFALCSGDIYFWVLNDARDIFKGGLTLI